MPALRWVPPGADLVAVAERLGDVLSAAKQLAAFSPQVDLSLLGESPWDAQTWSQRGVDEAKASALFVSGSSLTVVMPVREAGTLSSWTSSQAQGEPVPVAYRGREVSRTTRGVATWSWLEVKGFFLLHIEVAKSSGATSGTDLPWLDRILDASEGKAFSATKVARDAHDFGKRDALWGSANILPLLSTLVGGQEYLSCTELLGKLEGLLFAGSMGEDGAKLRSVFRLAEAEGHTIAGLQTPSVSPGMLAQRSISGAYASIAVDLQATGEALRGAQCPELAGLLQDPLAQAGWSPPPRAVHVAGSNFRTSDLSGTVALDVSLRNKRYIKKQLERIPMRSFLESSITVEGKRVKRLSIPTMSSLYYQLGAERFLFATKKKIMRGLLTKEGEGGAVGSELLALGLWPQRVPQLRALLRQLIPQRETREALWLILEGLDHAQGSLHLRGTRLELEVSVQARQN